MTISRVQGVLERARLGLWLDLAIKLGLVALAVLAVAGAGRVLMPGIGDQGDLALLVVVLATWIGVSIASASGRG